MEELNKEEIEKLMEIEGQARGVVFKTDTEYILAEKGEEGLRQVEEELVRLGHPLKYQEVKTMEFYPAGLRVLSVLAIKKVFNLDDEKIKEMGWLATKKSLVVKLFIKYFLSMERVFYKEAPRLWRKHWTVGELVPVKLDEQEKYVILQLKNFNLHPLYCSVYLAGYFSGILQMIVKTPQITCRETKCSLRGDEYNEYLLEWK